MKKWKRFFELFVVIAIIGICFQLFSTEGNSDTPEQRPTPDVKDNVALPKAPSGRLSVDGIWLDMTADQLRAVHGEPSRVHSRYNEYEQWDFHRNGRINVVLGPGSKVVTVDGLVLSKDGQIVAQAGTDLEELLPILGECRPPLDQVTDSLSPSFSLDGQLVHPQHRGHKVSRVSMTFDYSVVKPPVQQKPQKPEPEPGIILREPPPEPEGKPEPEGHLLIERPNPADSQP